MALGRHSGWFILASLLMTALLSGCGGSSDNDRIPTSVEVFNQHSLVFRNDGTLMATGYNAYGQLGDGSRDNRSAAVPVQGLGTSPIGGFAAGATHSIAFTNNSTAWTWGFNNFGQLGNTTVLTGENSSTDDYRALPVRVEEISRVTSVAAGAFHSLAVSARKVYGWGLNSSGQLGTNSTTNAAKPVQVVSTIDTPTGPREETFAQVAAGSYHSLALSEDGKVYAWGDNSYGQLGVAPAAQGGGSKTPLPVTFNYDTGSDPIEEVAAGGRFSLARTRQGKVFAWGYNEFGQLGRQESIGTKNPNPDPKQVVFDPPVTVTKLAAGLAHVVARSDDGRAWAWGFNERGQLGNNPLLGNPAQSPNSATPVQMLFGGSTGQVGTGTPITGVTEVRAFGNSTLVSRIDPITLALQVWGWGDNGFGQLGVAAAKSGLGFRAVPVLMEGL